MRGYMWPKSQKYVTTYHVLAPWGSQRKECSNGSTLDSLLKFIMNMLFMPLGFVLHLMRPSSEQVPDRAVTLRERIAPPPQLSAKIDGLQLTMARLKIGAQHELGRSFRLPS